MGLRCIQVKAGDRLGLLVKETPSSLSYEWDFNNAMVMVYSKGPNDAYPITGESVTFDALSFPYHFSFSAMVDVGRFNCIFMLFVQSDKYFFGY